MSARKICKDRLALFVIVQLPAQICYAAKTWYGDLIGMMIFGVSEVSGNVDLGEETRTMVCKFVIRSSSGTLVDEITADVQNWLDDLTDCSVRVVSDAEVQVSSLNSCRNSLQVPLLSSVILFSAMRPYCSFLDSFIFGLGLILFYHDSPSNRLQRKRNLSD